MQVHDNANHTDGIGEFRRLRLAAGISQEALARRADCSTSMVRLIENGYRPSGSPIEARIRAVLANVTTSEAAPAGGSATTSDSGARHVEG